MNAFTAKPNLSAWAKEMKHQHSSSKGGGAARAANCNGTPVLLPGSRPARNPERKAKP